MEVNVNALGKEFPQSGENCCNCLNNNLIYTRAGLEGLSLNQTRISPDPASDGQERNVSCEEGKRWFVMRDLKRPNAKLPAYKLLEQERIEVFTPVKKIPVTMQGRRVYRDVPFIQDLLFVHSTTGMLDPLLEKTPTLQYRYIRGRKYRDPLTVPDGEMERFICAVRSSDNLRYYLPGELTAAMYGRKVRVIGGPLDNYVGRLLKGVKKKVLLIELCGLLSVGVEVSPDYIQFV